MTRLITGFLALLILAALLIAPPDRSLAAEKPELIIGYLEVEDDPRYEQKRGYAGVQFRPQGRPKDGARAAFRESKVIGRALGIKFRLDEVSAGTGTELISTIKKHLKDHPVQMLLVDLDANLLVQLADALKGLDILLFNISARADRLRGADCRANIQHVIPSYAMQTDSLAQFLSAQRWREVFVLTGPHEEDLNLTRAFERSAARFGLRIVENKSFELSNDPRQREKNNVRLMTSGPDHDVVFLADTDGEFGRYVPYQTNRPRPVVGTEGLLASAWHWSWERHGAPQLNQRFERRIKRHKSSVDWAAWAAIKVIVEAAVRTGEIDFPSLRGYIRGDELTLDGYKGNPMSFRPWDNQLRQPMLVHTHNAVIERTPIRGFLHKTQNLDTLGYDAGDKECQFQSR